MVARVQISGVGLTDANPDGFYTFAINPVSFIENDSKEVNYGRTLDGYSFEMLPQFDGRIKTFEWRGLPNKEPYQTMVTNLKSMIGQVSGYLRLKDLSGSEGNTTETNIRVTNVITKWRDGSGPSTATSNLKYDFIRLEFVLRG